MVDTVLNCLYLCIPFLHKYLSSRAHRIAQESPSTRSAQNATIHIMPSIPKPIRTLRCTISIQSKQHESLQTDSPPFALPLFRRNNIPFYFPPCIHRSPIDHDRHHPSHHFSSFPSQYLPKLSPHCHIDLQKPHIECKDLEFISYPDTTIFNLLP